MIHWLMTILKNIFATRGVFATQTMFCACRAPSLRATPTYVYLL